MTTRREFLMGAAALVASAQAPESASVERCAHTWHRGRCVSCDAWEPSEYQRWMWETVKDMKGDTKIVIVTTRHHIVDLYRCIKRG